MGPLSRALTRKRFSIKSTTTFHDHRMLDGVYHGRTETRNIHQVRCRMPLRVRLPSFQGRKTYEQGLRVVYPEQVLNWRVEFGLCGCLSNRSRWWSIWPVRYSKDDVAGENGLFDRKDYVVSGRAIKFDEGKRSRDANY